ncbi:MAG: RnfABCDGE type electron transport complex subunit D [bacterium]|nr:RnfABCDGE type electron transport complex subunit D [bacterium]
MKAFLPIHLLIIFLALLTWGALLNWSGLPNASWLAHIRNFVAIFLSGYILSHILQRVLGFSHLRIEHRIITTFILFLLIDPIHPWWVFFGLGIFVELAERLIRSQAGPIFNPAALTAFVFGYLGYYPGWWGMNFQPNLSLIPGGMSIAMLLTVPLAGYVAYRYKKHHIVFSFLVTFLVAYILFFKEIPIFFLLEGTMAFFLLVMVIEPKTSPVIKKEQYIYGAIIGLGMPLVMQTGWFEATLGTLLLANLYTARKYILKKLELLMNTFPIQSSDTVR